MSIPLIIDSSTSVNPTTPNDITIRFTPPIVLDDGIYQIALSKFYCWYSWYNISVAKNNNFIKYYNGSIWQDIIIPDGQYTLDQLNDFVHSVLFTNGDYTVNAYGETVFDLNILPNDSTLRTIINVTNGYQLDLTLSKLYLLLGFNSLIISTSGDGPYPANINDDINTLLIHCSAITGSCYANSTKSDIIHTFVPSVRPGSNISESIPERIYFNINVSNNNLEEIRVTITDQLDRPIDFNNQPVTYFFDIRRYSTNKELDNRNQ
jgi:hypothetical protein